MSVSVSRAGSPGRRGPGAATALAVQRGAVVRAGSVQAGRGQVLALLWMVLLVWQLWVPQEVGGSGSVQGHRPTSPVPTGVAGSCARCWSGGAPAGAGTGATARGRLTGVSGPLPSLL